MKAMVSVAVLGLVLCVARSVSADTLTFDDLTPTSSYGAIPDGYGGFNWSTDFYYINRHYHSGSGYDLGTVSGEYSAFNAFANVVSASQSDFDFNGAYLTSAWDSSLYIDLKGFKDGNVIYSQTVVVSNTAPTWFTFDFLNIDTLQIASRGSQFVMDNMLYNDGSEVPAPSAIIGMIGLGAVGLVGAVRRRKQAA